MLANDDEVTVSLLGSFHLVVQLLLAFTMGQEILTPPPVPHFSGVTAQYVL
jgi:hypothetical protein